MTSLAPDNAGGPWPGRRVWACASALGALGWAEPAWAAQACAHPLQGTECVAPFALVSLMYAVIAGAYAAGALLILKPQLRRRAWGLALLGVAPFGWLAAMFGFTLAGAAGWLTFPHDASPFFYIDWLVVVVVLALQTGYVAAAWWLGQPESGGASAGVPAQPVEL